MILLLVIAGILSLGMALAVQLYAQRGGYQLSGFLAVLGLIQLAAALIFKVLHLTGATP